MAVHDVAALLVPRPLPLRATVQRLANLIRVSLAYDNADRLIRLANLSSTGTTITSYVDRWDGVGNRLSRVEQDGTRVTWSYDSTYQLTNEQRSGANSYNTTYAYDPTGNRRSKLDNSVRTTYSYDAANQLSKFVDNTGTTTFGFGASGNQRLQIASAGGGTTTNTWDFENRLTKVALATGVLNTFTYNADNLRVQRQDSSGTLKELWDGLRILEERDQNDVVQVVYTMSSAAYGELVSQRRTGSARYFVFDPLGSAVRLMDGSQNVTDTYLYTAFGEVLLEGITNNPFRYVGKSGYYFDPDLACYYARGRESSPGTGRWLTLDPRGINASDPNGYRYVRNAPIISVDPSGHQGQSAPPPLGDDDLLLPTSIELPGPPPKPGPIGLPPGRTTGGQMKFGSTCPPNACMLVTLENGINQFVCNSTYSIIWVDGIYICKQPGQVFKLVDGCTMTVECLPNGTFNGYTVSCFSQPTTTNQTLAAIAGMFLTGGCKPNPWLNNPWMQGPPSGPVLFTPTFAPPKPTPPTPPKPKPSRPWPKWFLPL